MYLSHVVTVNSEAGPEEADEMEELSVNNVAGSLSAARSLTMEMSLSVRSTAPEEKHSNSHNASTTTPPPTTQALEAAKSFSTGAETSQHKQQGEHKDDDDEEYTMNLAYVSGKKRKAQASGAGGAKPLGALSSVASSRPTQTSTTEGGTSSSNTAAKATLMSETGEEQGNDPQHRGVRPDDTDHPQDEVEYKAWLARQEQRPEM